MKTKKGRSILVSDYDRDRLERLLADMEHEFEKDRQFIKDLRDELRRARIIKQDSMPPDVVTMNSTVKLRDLGTDELLTFKLVFPENADMEQQKISVLAPIGTAIIGFRVGDTVEWRVPSGIMRSLRIEDILYQPEASGDFHL